MTSGIHSQGKMGLASKGIRSFQFEGLYANPSKGCPVARKHVHPCVVLYRNPLGRSLGRYVG
jgi:hypothetical protein